MIQQSENHLTTMIAQKRTIRVILDIECYDDLDIEEQDWREILQLEGDEDVHVTIKDLADIFQFVPVRRLVFLFSIVSPY